MKKGEITIEYLIKFLIGLVALAIIIFGFSRIWSGGEDTIDDIYDSVRANDESDTSPIFIPLPLLMKTILCKKVKLNYAFFSK